MGRYLVEKLSKEGNEVRVLAREESDVSCFSALKSVSIVKGDVCEPSSLNAAVDGAEIVYHLVALLHLPHVPAHSHFRR